MPFTIRGASALAVRGAGLDKTHLWFTPGAGVEVLSCSDLANGGFSMDTIAPAFAQGVLRSYDAAGAKVGKATGVVEMDSEFPLPTSSYPICSETCPDGSVGKPCGEVKPIFCLMLPAGAADELSDRRAEDELQRPRLHGGGRPTVSAASGSARHAWGRGGVVVLEGATDVGDRWSGGARW